MEERDWWHRERQEAAEQYLPHNVCGKGHRRSLALETAEGGCICLPCFAALLSDPRSPSHHVSYALFQLSRAISDPYVLRELRGKHAYFIVSPLVSALSVFDDEALARQVIDLVSDLCFRRDNGGLGEVDERSASSLLSGDFIARIADWLAGTQAWSRRQIRMLHCFGVLLSSFNGTSPAAHIREQAALFSNLFVGLQLPSEELRGEVLFVIYKLCSSNVTPWDDLDSDIDNGIDSLDAGATTLVRLTLEILLRTQYDEVRMNCLALLLILVGKGFQSSFLNSYHNLVLEEASKQKEEITQQTPLINLFADAIKGPLLSSDEEIQIRTLDLIFYMLSPGNCSLKQILVLVKEDIPDYIFEVLRLSANKEPIVMSCIRALTLFTTVEEAFNQKLVLGLPTLLSILHYTSQLPLHPAQPQALNLVCNCVSSFPGIMSTSQVEDLALILTSILKRCINGEYPETFLLACSTFVEILKSPSSSGIQKIGELVQEASRGAVLYSLSFPQGNSTLLITHSLALLKEAQTYCNRECSNKVLRAELEECFISTCQNYFLPWMERVIDEEVEDNVIEDVLQTFHLILLSSSEVQSQIFANALLSSCWFTLSFKYLGLFQTDQMRTTVYLSIASLIDRAFGPDFGQPVRDACVFLPFDPLELVFLLGQKHSLYPELPLCQCAAILILYVTSLSGERLADDAQVLASLEQYILVNCRNFLSATGNYLILALVLHLYGLLRCSPAGINWPYSREAEETLFILLAKDEVDLLCIEVHPMALEWLFQQEGFMAFLSHQILRFCRFLGPNETLLIVHQYGRKTINMQMISELVVSGDNYVAPLLVSLLKELQEEGAEDDMLCVLNTMAGILQKFPNASIQFCLHNVAGTVRSIYYSKYCSSQLFAACSLLVFNILHTANHKVISQDEEWHAVTIKLMEFIKPKLGSPSWGQEEYLVLAIFCLILYHSRNQVFGEASKAILLNGALASLLNDIVQTACTRGPALLEQDEESEPIHRLAFILLLYFFSLNSFPAVLPEHLDWQELLQSSNDAPPLLILSIKCHDLCRFLHFGRSLLKLISSECLVGILGRITVQRERMHEELRCPFNYLQSMIAIIESLVLYEESSMANNCSICLSMIITWETLGLQDQVLVRNSKWFRMILEEFTMTLIAPSLASNYFKYKHKPASHIATALLNLEKEPQWMRSLFNITSISGIVKNLSVQNLTLEMVNLFRTLLSKRYLNEDHIECLNQLFQVYKRQVYKDISISKSAETLDKKFLSKECDTGKLCCFLVDLMLSLGSNKDGDSKESVLKEIDRFSKELSTTQGTFSSA